MRLFRILMRLSAPPRRASRLAVPALIPQTPREMRVVVPLPSAPPPVEAVLWGRCWVVDGDTIVIDKVHIRLAGIDAPELDHPWGQQARWALVKLCKGHVVTARIKPEMSYNRVVAECFLPDGRDLAAELVKQGLALDWSKFSGGKYRHLEQADARRKLWRAAVRQRGMASLLDDLSPVAPRLEVMQDDRIWHSFASSSAAGAVRYNWRRWLSWLVLLCLLLLPLGFGLVSTGTISKLPQVARQSAPSPEIFVVTPLALNVRERPTGNAIIISRLKRGQMVVPFNRTGAWYAILLQDGTTGWVHSDFLAPAGS